MLMISIIFFSYFAEPPPRGTIKISKNFYADQTEILNIHYLEYLHFQRIEQTDTIYQTLLPSDWNHWYANPEARRWPLVGISHSQAVDYCKWRSKIVSGKYGKQVTYRLPTIEEWNQLYSWFIDNYSEKRLVNEQRKISFQLKAFKGINFLETPRFDEVNESKILFHLLDNVSEMTSEPGLAKGGNNEDFIHYKENKDWQLHYAKPTPMVGFRCVAEFVED